MDLYVKQKCKNPEESNNNKCVKCNKCGRYSTQYVADCPFCKTHFDVDSINSDIDMYKSLKSMKQYHVKIKCPICKNLFFKLVNEVEEKLEESE